jgi:hypothetical protein
MTNFIRTYFVAGAGLVALYGASEVRGWEFDSSPHARIDPALRQSPGGWRSWTFWHQGIHGGK